MKKKTCPICDWEITDAGIEVQTAQKTVLVCCEDCAAKARAQAKPATKAR